MDIDYYALCLEHLILGVGQWGFGRVVSTFSWVEIEGPSKSLLIFALCKRVLLVVIYG